VAVTVLDGIFIEKDGVISHRQGQLRHILPSAQRASRQRTYVRPQKWLKDAYTVVQDVIARRADGRAATANPLDTFEQLLAGLGHDRFRAWWTQIKQELRGLDPSLQPAAIIDHAASLAEAALCFVVPRAQAAGLMRNVDASKPRQWRFIDLIKGSKSGDKSVRPILDERTAQRGLDLNEAKQRRHAGFLIDTAPTGPIPDLKPEQARDALLTTDLIVRRVIDWLAELTAAESPGP
jgi:hypothetical protein